MEYFLFTYPECARCDELKKYLRENSLSPRVQEFNLVQKESKLKIREFLGHVRRDEKGAIIIPTMVVREDEQVQAVLNSRQELEEWLKLRA
jgi:arsenate reductase-like glutaredoxin family protein